MIVDEIIKEINACLDNGCVIAALTSALILPDICAKAIYPELKKQNKVRYIKWYEEYIGQYEHSLFPNANSHYPSGELIYSLRCSLLHEGNPNIENNKFGIEYFELIYNKVQGTHMTSYSSESQLVEDENSTEKEINKKISVNVRDICNKICLLAKACYEENKDKFNFFNYNLVNIDFQTRESFVIKKEDIFK